MTASAIYSGVVKHARPGRNGMRHRLRYRVFMLALDLDELDRLDRRFACFAHNRPALCALFDRDHGDRSGAPLRSQIEARLGEAGLAHAGARIVLLTMPRLFNYVFNPLSVYFCYAADGALAAIAHEVANTFGERHLYVLPAQQGEDGVVAQACAKRFFVSPFLEMDLDYEFRITPPGERAVVAMNVKRGAELALSASFSGKRRPLSDGDLLAAWASHPLMTFKVIAGIHWEALRMWLKGVRYLGRGARAPLPQMETARGPAAISRGANPPTPAPGSR